MPLYDIKCRACKHEWEGIRTLKEVSDKDGYFVCPKCGLANGKVQITCSRNKDSFRKHWNENFGEEPIYVKSKKHYKELCKKHKVISRAEGDFRNYYDMQNEVQA